MIEGVRALPWLSVHERLKTSGADMLNCSKCKTHYRHDARRAMRCGYVPREEWSDDAPILMARRLLMAKAGLRDFDTCPGYTASLPDVYEAADAWGWWDKGQLQVRHKDPSPLLLELVVMFNISNSSAQQFYLEEQTKG